MTAVTAGLDPLRLVNLLPFMERTSGSPEIVVGSFVALTGDKLRLTLQRRGLDGAGEFGEGHREPMPRIDIDTEFIVASAQVLHEHVPGVDYGGRAEVRENEYFPRL